MHSIYVMGDLHGQYAKATRILQEAGLLASDLSWSGGEAELWFMGDFFDRGPDGIGCLDLVMRLQTEAAAAGGKVEALLGNHEPLILGALRFPNAPSTGPGKSFLADWEMNGGLQSDLERLTPAHVDWLTSRPALALVGDDLLAHADALFYTRYGATVDQVNAAMGALLTGDDTAAWDQLLGDFAERLAFRDRPDRAAAFLQQYGGKRIIHGHTPISYMSAQPPAEVTEAYPYRDGLCVNVDAGLYRGSPGFLFLLG